MKKLSIDLLNSFLVDIFKDTTGFTFKAEPVEDYSNHWHFSVTIVDTLVGIDNMELKMKVDYLDKSVWIETSDKVWEKVESDRWTCKFFWYTMYCKK